MNSQLNVITLTNQSGMTVKLLNYGASVASIILCINDKPQEVTVNYDNPMDFLTDPFYLGATCGPVANRISNAQFDINGTHYSVSANSGKHCLHGGTNSFSSRYWDIDDACIDENIIKFSLKINHLEDDFPGNREITAQYQLTDDNQLKITYTGKTDQLSPINMTNHTYFNLGETSCLDHVLQVSSSAILERFDDGTLTGAISSAHHLVKNIRSDNKVADLIQHSPHEQVKEERGLDHSFILDNSPFSRPKITLASAANDITLSVFTDQPTVQVYTGNYLSDPFAPRQGICLECQGYVDAPNHPSFTSVLVGPEQTYLSNTIYKFDHK